jgi:EpsI family protein
VATETWDPSFPGALREDLGRYRESGTGNVVDVYVVSYGPASPAGDLASSANQLYQPEVWRLASPAGATGSLDGRPYGELVLRGPGDTGRLVWFWYRVQGERTLSRARVKALELQAVLRGRPLEAGLVALSAPFEEDPDTARTRLARFVATLCPGQADCVLAP